MSSKPAAVTANQSAIRFDWLFSQRNDLLFFFAPILVGYLCFSLMRTAEIKQSILLFVFINSGFGASPMHLGATWFSYLDKANLNYWWQNKEKRMVFFLAPPLLLITSVVAAFLNTTLLFLVWQFWSILHLVQQNIGILLLYHRPSAGEAIVERKLEVRSQQLAALFFYLVFVHRIMLGNQPGIWFDVIKLVSLAAAGIAIVMYLVELSKQIRSGKHLNGSAFLFWVFSVLCLTPLAFIGKDFSEAYVIPNVVHWFQYLGINYMLVSRKYSTETEYRGNLPGFHPLLMFVGMCLVLFLIMETISCFVMITRGSEFLFPLFVGLSFGFGFCHYFQDSFIWRFRDPFLRQTVLPFVKGTVAT
jgi:hypothetical protein